jgi:ubiquinone/menaquinone biosynthesis C-methylase UbiE
VPTLEIDLLVGTRLAMSSSMSAPNDGAPDDVEALFDQIGDWEWLRLDSDVRGRVAFAMHRRLLARYLTSGMRVLEIGAGPGRFTIALAQMGCRVVVSDVSSVQLALNEEHVNVAGVAASIEARVQLDVRDLSRFEDGSFDAVVAYGGPLSYVFEDASQALRECFRVTRAQGPVLASVMSLAGSGRCFVESFLPTIDVVGLDTFRAFLDHGDQRVLAGVPGTHPCRLFTWDQVQALVAEAGGEVHAGLASNWLSLGPDPALRQFEESEELWNALLDWEERFCAEPGAIDGGAHILFAARPRR